MPGASLTDLQFLVIQALLNADQAGRDIREYLKQHRVAKSAPAFYQLMARLEDAGFVKGRYETRMVDGQRLQERWYKLVGAGRRAYEQTQEFYLGQAGGGLGYVR